MSQERTEKPTPRRREEGRKKGQIARRPELPAVVGFLSVPIMMRVWGGDMIAQATHLYISTFRRAITNEPLTPLATHQLLSDSAAKLAALTLPVITVALVAGLASNFAQGGLVFTPEALKPKAEAFNPVSRIKRIFGSNGPVELVKAIIKIICLFAVCLGAFTYIRDVAPSFVGLPAEQVFSATGSFCFEVGLRAGAMLLFVAALDYAYGWYKNEKSLRMTKQEVKDEYRQSEGDPLVKSQRRRMARNLLQRRIGVEVPRADVVVTNPTHFAVALRYDREKDVAPMVVVKGADEMAKRIREIAKANDVPVVENPPLARALYRTVKEGRTITPELFRAVAELLAYVYRLRERSFTANS